MHGLGAFADLRFLRIQVDRIQILNGTGKVWRNVVEQVTMEPADFPDMFKFHSDFVCQSHME